MVSLMIKSGFNIDDALQRGKTMTGRMITTSHPDLAIPISKSSFTFSSKETDLIILHHTLPWNNHKQ